MSRIKFGDWTLRPPWTEQHAHALLVLATHHTARCSSIFQTGMMPPTVFRTSADFLVSRGLARISNNGLGFHIELTDAGHNFVKTLDKQVNA